MNVKNAGDVNIAPDAVDGSGGGLELNEKKKKKKVFVLE